MTLGNSKGEYLAPDGSVLAYVTGGPTPLPRKALLKPFFIAKRAVRVRQFGAWVERSGVRPRSETVGGMPAGAKDPDASHNWRRPDGTRKASPEAPVTQVHWTDALDYASAHDLELASEAQWEHARERGHLEVETLDLVPSGFREWCHDVFRTTPGWWGSETRDPLEVRGAREVFVPHVARTVLTRNRADIHSAVGDTGFRVALSQDGALRRRKTESR